MPRSRRPRLRPGWRLRDRDDRAGPDEVEHPREIAEVRFHDLRHSFGSSMASQSVALQIIGKAHGHRSIRSTKRYARPGEESLRATVEASALVNQSSAMNPLRELRAKTKTGEECRRRLTHSPDWVLYGAGHEGRTRDIYLGKVALYH